MPNHEHLPKPLIAALREMDKGRVFIPPERDEVILARARAEFVRGRNRRIIPWLAAAAALMIAAFVILTPAPPKIREDVNRDSRVDIRDALLLARKISDGQAKGSVWDLNHDGRVDQSDVGAITRWQ